MWNELGRTSFVISRRDSRLHLQTGEMGGGGGGFVIGQQQTIKAADELCFVCERTRRRQAAEPWRRRRALASPQRPRLLLLNKRKPKPLRNKTDKTPCK